MIQKFNKQVHNQMIRNTTTICGRSQHPTPLTGTLSVTQHNEVVMHKNTKSASEVNKVRLDFVVVWMRMFPKGSGM